MIDQKAVDAAREALNKIGWQGEKLQPFFQVVAEFVTEVEAAMKAETTGYEGKYPNKACIPNKDGMFGGR